ncbi:MAG: SMC-Scp complex subunit ScpB [Proteobacteria bacterium]|nr:SMC-Scp complex subunit ScpB [Pseudomonadota bacterium]
MENRRDLIPLVEAIIFASDKPISADKIAKYLEIEKEAISEIVDYLMEYYKGNETRGIEIAEVAEGFFFRTKLRFSPSLKKVVLGKEAQLSKSLMETLSIIAFKQPITRAEIEHLRGVDSNNAIRGLLEKKLIKIVGRKDVPGRPHVYGTTKEFLLAFGLKSLLDLPNLREIKEMEKERAVQPQLIGDDYEDKASEDNS